MAVKIILNQVGKPAGEPGYAREDFVLGVPVALSLDGGPYLAQFWSILDKPVDLSVPQQSGAGIPTPNVATTTLEPVDVEGTYLVQCVVDAGYGLGARPEDVAQVTFYAGAALASQWDALPRRVMAYLERNQHNVKGDPIYGVVGNARGWAQEWLRWFGVIKRHDATTPTTWGRVHLTAGAATLVQGRNVATVTRTALGTVRVQLTKPQTSTNYAVGAWARGAPGGSATASNEQLSEFTIERADPFGALVDADLTFAVWGT